MTAFTETVDVLTSFAMLLPLVGVSVAVMREESVAVFTLKVAFARHR